MKKIKSIKYYQYLNLFSSLMLLSTFLYLIICWSTIPQKIPGHYNGSGIIDRWGNKSELWFVYIIAVLMLLGLSAIEHFSKTRNTYNEMTKIDFEKVSLLTKEFIVTNKFFLTLNFTFLTINSSLCLNLPTWYNLVVFTTLFAVAIVYMIKFLLVKKSVFN